MINTEAPVAPEIQTEAPVATNPEVPTGSEDLAATAATTETPAAEEQDTKKRRDRLAEQGRKLADTTRLIQEQAGVIARLESRLEQMGNFLTRQQEQAVEARLADLPPEEQAIERVKMLEARLRQGNPQPVVQPVPQVQVNPEVASILAAFNDLHDLNDDPITGLEPELHASLHPNRASFVRAVEQLARERTAGEEVMPTAKKPAAQAAQTPDVSTLVASEVAKEMAKLGIGRPNAAQAVGGMGGNASIADMNKLAGNNALGPRARVAALQKGS